MEDESGPTAYNAEVRDTDGEGHVEKKRNAHNNQNNTTRSE